MTTPTHDRADRLTYAPHGRTPHAGRPRDQLREAVEHCYVVAADQYLNTGRINPDLRDAAATLAALYQAAQTAGQCARLGRIADTLEAEIIE